MQGKKGESTVKGSKERHEEAFRNRWRIKDEAVRKFGKNRANKESRIKKSKGETELNKK